MGRKSSIARLPERVQTHITRRLRENRLTLDQLIADLIEAFPDEAKSGGLPSRSAVHRHSQAVAEIVAHERDMAIAANALVAELGEEFDAKSGALLAQAVTTLASRTAMRRIQDGDEMEIGDVLDLARAAKAAQEARSLNLRERQAVAKAAREKLIEEQNKKLDTISNRGLSPETIAEIRRSILGIAA
jgi:hypothetical protein